MPFADRRAVCRRASCGSLFVKLLVILVSARLLSRVCISAVAHFWADLWSCLPQEPSVGCSIIRQVVAVLWKKTCFRVRKATLLLQVMRFSVVRDLYSASGGNKP
jgi:hypothetical protein